jgi:lysophospholipase L1-like esterase
VALLTIACAVGWVLLESGALGLLYHRESQQSRQYFHTRGPNVQRVITPVPGMMPGITGAARFTTDARGIRAPYPPEEHHVGRVLCIGGSTTECVYLDDTSTWPALFMTGWNETDEKVTTWVGNVGISGFDTRDHLRFLRETSLLEGIDVVILQPGINDFWRYLAGEEGHTKFDRFETQHSQGSLKKVHRTPLWTRSRVIQLYHDLRRQGTASEPGLQEGVGGEEYRIRRDKRAKARIQEALPDLERGLREYAARIRAIIAVCREKDLQVCFTTQPVLWQENLPAAVASRCWFGWLENGDYLSIAALRQGMDQYNEVLKKTCRAEEVRCFDLADMNGKPDFFYDDCHFTEAGAREVAKTCIFLARLISQTK